MISTFAKPHPGITAHWWVPLVRGIVSLLFGIAVIAFPLSAIVTLVIFFGAFAFVDGVLAIVQALRTAHPITPRWWAHIAAGVVGISIGIVTLVLPGLTAFILGALIAAWAIITGVLEIVAGVGIRNDRRGEILMIVAGAFSVILGVVLFFIPLAALLASVWVIGIYAIVAGISLIALSFRLRPRSGTVTPA